MLKKFTLLLAAMAVLAFAVPAFASATTGLTESGKLVEVGKKVEATNIGAVLLTSAKLGTITCDEVTLTGTVATNTAATVRVTGDAGKSFAKLCMKNDGTAVTVKNIVLTEIHTEGKIKEEDKEAPGKFIKEGKFVVNFELEVGGLTCKFTTAGSAGHYTEGTDVITTEEGKLSASPIACGTTATLDGKFTIKTDVSEVIPLILD
jgi:hypothetical protein